LSVAKAGEWTRIQAALNLRVTKPMADAHLAFSTTKNVAPYIKKIKNHY